MKKTAGMVTSLIFGGVVTMETRATQVSPVVRCTTCGLVQYTTRTGNCRRCLRRLPGRIFFALPTPADPLPGDAQLLNHVEKTKNDEMVENIGKRMRQLRESHGITQSQLASSAKVSRSYISRLESGQMTPSIGVLEKIAEAIGVGLPRFFVAQETDAVELLDDPFIQSLRPFLRQLEWLRWQAILKWLRTISEHVAPQIVRPHPLRGGKPKQWAAGLSPPPY